MFSRDRWLEIFDTIKKVFINSGIRYDLILNDKRHGNAYLSKLTRDNVSGQMKVAPEHTETQVLSLMGKQGIDDLLAFKEAFDRLSKQSDKKQFLTYYLIAAHPGCDLGDMTRLKKFTSEKLNINPEQVQIFTPTPSTFSTLMYYTGLDPFTLKKIFVERNPQGKEKQKQVVTVKAKGFQGKKSRPYKRKSRPSK